MSVRKKIVHTKGEPVTWWLADYSDGAGKRHQRRFPTKKEAAEHHDQTKTAIRAGRHVSLSAALTIAGAADKWLKKVAADTSKLLFCPMPGLIVSVNVAVGQEVKAGETLAIVEAMKMENVLTAEQDATVRKINAKKGDSLALDDVILEFA